MGRESCATNEEVKYMVSVIIPLFKGKKYIPHLIEMLEKNSIYGRVVVEVILVNDSPEDNIVASDIYSTIVEIKIINNAQNRGIHGSRVEGLKQAKGYYILFVDQDDDLAENYIQSQLECIGDADAVVCNGIHKNGADELIYKSIRAHNAAVTKEYFLANGCTIMSPGQVILRRNSVPDYWKENIMLHNGADDAFLWTLLFCMEAKFVPNYEVLYTHNETGVNASSNHIEMIKSVTEWAEKIEACNDISRWEKEEIKDACKKTNELSDMWRQIAVRIKDTGEREKIGKIIIYGWGARGRELYGYLKQNGVRVDAVIDVRAPELKICDCAIFPPEEVPNEPAIMIISIKSEERIKIKENFSNLQNIKTFLLSDLMN